MSQTHSIFAPNTTQTPNVIFDFWMCILSPCTFKVLCAITRKTFGWGKEWDAISSSQMEKLAGMSDQGVKNSIDELLEHGLIQKIEQKKANGADAPPLYTIIVHTSPYGQLEKEGGPTPLGEGANTVGGEGQHGWDTKDTLTKDTKQKDVCPAGAAKTFSSSSNKETILKTNVRGEQVQITRSKIFENAIKYHPKWKTGQIEEAIQILIDYPNKVSDCWEFIVGTVQNIQNKEKSNQTQKRKQREPECSKTQMKKNNEEEISNKNEECGKKNAFSELVTAEQLFPEFFSIPKTSQS